jgi:hypothetical protein
MTKYCLENENCTLSMKAPLSLHSLAKTNYFIGGASHHPTDGMKLRVQS